MAILGWKFYDIILCLNKSAIVEKVNSITTLTEKFVLIGFFVQLLSH